MVISKKRKRLVSRKMDLRIKKAALAKVKEAVKMINLKIKKDLIMIKMVVSKIKKAALVKEEEMVMKMDLKINLIKIKVVVDLKSLKNKK